MYFYNRFKQVNTSLSQKCIWCIDRSLIGTATPGHKWKRFGLVNGILTSYGLFNAGIWLIFKCLIVIIIIYIFNIYCNSF